MRIGILSRLDMPDAIKLADKLYYLLKKECDVSLDESLLPHIRGDPISECDVLVTIGGDGTILYAARRYSVPLIGINMGRHGFLCELQPTEISLLPDLIEDHRTEERVKLAFDGEGEALNEVVVRGKTPTKSCHLRLEWERKETYLGDGLIIATPTGSTAYSLSAGGPVVPYDVPVFLLTPLCPLDRRVRPLIVNDDATFRLTVQKEDCYLASDGVLKRELAVGDSFEARKSRNKAIFWRRR